jgi:hypothetical protein
VQDTSFSRPESVPSAAPACAHRRRHEATSLDPGHHLLHQSTDWTGLGLRETGRQALLLLTSMSFVDDDQSASSPQ